MNIWGLQKKRKQVTSNLKEHLSKPTKEQNPRSIKNMMAKISSLHSEIKQLKKERAKQRK